jgi:3-hydroxy-9,10-secoandrosta-1,3,5(10)-triene-9,17-dione monooxygenase
MNAVSIAKPTLKQETLSEAELLRRLEAMVPKLKERANETEQLRRLPDQTIEEAWESGFLSAFRTRYWGGPGLGLSALANGARILAHGCGSSAWTLVFLAQHVWMFAKADLKLQEELLGGDGRPGTMAGALAQLGTAEPTEGGYLVTAESDWNSGVMHSDWVNCKVDIDGEVYMAVLPTADVEIVDIWHTSGMRGSGSNRIKVEKAFVPHHRLQKSSDFLGSQAPSIHDDEPFVSYPFVPVVMSTMSGVQLGMAEAAVEEFGNVIKRRVLAFTGGAKQVDQQVSHLRIGEAIVELRALQTLWHSMVARIIDAYETRRGMETEERVKIRHDAAYIVTKCAKLVGHVTASTGGSSYFNHSPLQRIQRDVEVLSSHATLDWDRGMQMGGKVALGIPLAPTDLI